MEQPCLSNIYFDNKNKESCIQTYDKILSSIKNNQSNDLNFSEFPRVNFQDEYNVSVQNFINDNMNFSYISKDGIQYYANISVLDSISYVNDNSYSNLYYRIDEFDFWKKIFISDINLVIKDVCSQNQGKDLIIVLFDMIQNNFQLKISDDYGITFGNFNFGEQDNKFISVMYTVKDNIIYKICLSSNTSATLYFYDINTKQTKNINITFENLSLTLSKPYIFGFSISTDNNTLIITFDDFGDKFSQKAFALYTFKLNQNTQLSNKINYVFFKREKTDQFDIVSNIIGYDFNSSSSEILKKHFNKYLSFNFINTVSDDGNIILCTQSKILQYIDQVSKVKVVEYPWSLCYINKNDENNPKNLIDVFYSKDYSQLSFGSLFLPFTYYEKMTIIDNNIYLFGSNSDDNSSKQLDGYNFYFINNYFNDTTSYNIMMNITKDNKVLYYTSLTFPPNSPFESYIKDMFNSRINLSLTGGDLRPTNSIITKDNFIFSEFKITGNTLLYSNQNTNVNLRASYLLKTLEKGAKLKFFQNSSFYIVKDDPTEFIMYSFAIPINPKNYSSNHYENDKFIIFFSYLNNYIMYASKDKSSSNFDIIYMVSNIYNSKLFYSYCFEDGSKPKIDPNCVSSYNNYCKNLRKYYDPSNSKKYPDYYDIEPRCTCTDSISFIEANFQNMDDTTKSPLVNSAPCMSLPCSEFNGGIREESVPSQNASLLCDGKGINLTICKSVFNLKNKSKINTDSFNFIQNCQNSLDKQCINDTDCSENEKCLENKCISKSIDKQCTNDTDCSENEKCSENKCIAKTIDPPSKTNYLLIILISVIVFIIILSISLYFYFKKK
jgi:hypothetical protein